MKSDRSETRRSRNLNPSSAQSSRGRLRPKGRLRGFGWTFRVLTCLCCSGCYGAVGPSIGYPLATNRPTLGWELSAATFAVGQSYLVGRPRTPAYEGRDSAWRRRTYFVWEPRIGPLPWGDNDQSGLRFAGSGLTIGARIDRPAADGEDRVGWVSGVWAGGGYAFPRSTPAGCDDDTRPYVSIAFGVRGNELYFTPKVGVMQVPKICVGLSSF